LRSGRLHRCAFPRQVQSGGCKDRRTCATPRSRQGRIGTPPIKRRAVLPTSSFFYRDRDRLAASRPSVAEGSGYIAEFRPLRLQSQTVETLNGVPRRKSGSCRLAGGANGIRTLGPTSAVQILRSGGWWYSRRAGNTPSFSRDRRALVKLKRLPIVAKVPLVFRENGQAAAP
jgi:hypothetical protein